MKRILSILLLIVTIGSIFYLKNQRASAGTINDKLVRFHVIANSDSAEDQAVKLKVRDAILEKVGSKLDRAKSAEDSLALINADLGEIEQIANGVLQKEGKSYKAKAYVGKFDFPVKQYNTITLPAGQYNALRVVLGNGDGKNWWCVMFPPLCFIDITHGLTDEKTDEELRKVLSDDEVKSINAFKQNTEKKEVTSKAVSDTTANYPEARNDTKIQPNVEFRFKIVEILQSAFKKISSIFK